MGNDFRDGLIVGKNMEPIVLPDNIINSLEYFYPIFKHIKNGITLTDENSKILYVNPAFTQITGYSQEEAIGNNPGMLRSGYHDEIFYKNIWKNIESQDFWEGQIWNRKKSGTLYPSLVTITALRDTNNKIHNYLAIFSDITFLDSEKAEQMNLAFYDPLTQLPNRLALKELFIKSTGQYQRKHYTQTDSDSEKIAILFFDLNKFKQVNDTYGHVVGDKLLKEVAKRSSSAIRKVDLIARFGGDEFVGVFEVKAEMDIKICCQRLHDALASPYKIDGKNLDVSASIGISIYPDEGEDFDTLINKADEAMYYAKKNGLEFYFYKQLKQV